MQATSERRILMSDISAGYVLLLSGLVGTWYTVSLMRRARTGWWKALFPIIVQIAFFSYIIRGDIATENSCLIVIIGAATLAPLFFMARNAMDAIQLQKTIMGEGNASERRPKPGREGRGLSVIVRALFVITIIVFMVDLYFAIRIAMGYVKTVEEILTLQESSEQATGLALVHINAQMYYRSIPLIHSWDAIYPTSNGRLLIYLPLALAGIAFLFWQYQVRKFLVPLRTIGFWVMGLFGFLGFGALKVYWPTLELLGRLPAYYLLLASDVLVILSAIIGYRIIVNTHQP